MRIRSWQPYCKVHPYLYAEVFIERASVGHAILILRARQPCLPATFGCHSHVGCIDKPAVLLLGSTVVAKVIAAQDHD